MNEKEIKELMLKATGDVIEKLKALKQGESVDNIIIDGREFSAFNFKGVVYLIEKHDIIKIQWEE